MVAQSKDGFHAFVVGVAFGQLDVARGEEAADTIVARHAVDVLQIVITGERLIDSAVLEESVEGFLPSREMGVRRVGENAVHIENHRCNLDLIVAPGTGLAHVGVSCDFG